MHKQQFIPLIQSKLNLTAHSITKTAHILQNCKESMPSDKLSTHRFTIEELGHSEAINKMKIDSWHNGVDFTSVVVALKLNFVGDDPRRRLCFFVIIGVLTYAL